MYTIVIRNSQGKIIRSSKKWDRYTVQSANSLRNSLQAYWDREYPDLRCHAQVTGSERQYSLYDDIGLYMGTYPTQRAQELVRKYEDWTMVEQS